MTATAGARRPPRRDWIPARMGQVAMTIVAAQTTERRNGNITQMLAAASTPMASTPSVMRGRSRAGGGTFMAASPGSTGDGQAPSRPLGLAVRRLPAPPYFFLAFSSLMATAST